MLIEVTAIVRTLAFAQFVPPVFTQYVEIFGAARAHHFSSPVSLIAFISVSDEHGVSMSQRVFVKINIFVRNAFTELFFNCIAHR